MNWQYAIAAFLVALAGIYLLRRGWRVWRRGSGGCGKSCGCGSSKPAAPARIPDSDLVLRLRR